MKNKVTYFIAILSILLTPITFPATLYVGYLSYKYVQILRCENLNRDTITPINSGEVYDFENLSEVELQVSIVKANEVKVRASETKFGFYNGCAVKQDGSYEFILNGEPLYFSDIDSSEINYRNFALYNNSPSPKSSYNFKEQFETDITNNWKVSEISSGGIYFYNPDAIYDIILIFNGEGQYFIEPELGRSLPPYSDNIKLESIDVEGDTYVLVYSAAQESIDAIKNVGNSSTALEMHENWGDGSHSYCYKKPDLNNIKSAEDTDLNYIYKAESC